MLSICNGQHFKYGNLRMINFQICRKDVECQWLTSSLLVDICNINKIIAGDSMVSVKLEGHPHHHVNVRDAMLYRCLWNVVRMQMFLRNVGHVNSSHERVTRSLKLTNTLLHWILMIKQMSTLHGRGTAPWTRSLNIQSSDLYIHHFTTQQRHISQRLTIYHVPTTQR